MLYFSASYTVTYLLVGAIGVLTLLVVLWLTDVDRPSERQATTLSTRTAEFRKGLAEVVVTPPIFIAAGIEAVMYLGYGAFLGLPIYAKTVRLNDAEIAIILEANWRRQWLRSRSADGSPMDWDESRSSSSASSSAPLRFR